jgi:hypothetical protein
MRELTIDELDLVSGGYDPYDDGEEIVVTGSRGGSGSGYSMSWSQFQGMQSFYGSPFGGGGGSSYGGGSAAPAPTHHPDGTDNDGDGINETPPIVVTAPLTAAQAREAWDHALTRAQWQWYSAQLTATGASIFYGGWIPRAVIGFDVVTNAPPVNNAIIQSMAEANFALFMRSGGVGNFYQNQLMTPSPNP